MIRIPKNEMDEAGTLEALWRSFRRDLLGFLVRRLPTRADAEDVLQEIFLRIQDGAARLNAVENIEAWLYTIARRAVADHYRARSRLIVSDADPLDEFDESVSAEPDTSDNLSPYRGSHDVHEEVLSWLRPMIEELPEKYRLPLLMSDVDGKTQQEVANDLGLSLSGAKSRVQRARSLLGETLQRCCAVEFGEEGRAVSFERLRPQDDPCGEDGCGPPVDTAA